MTLGADISKWQGRVHWGRLAETDIRFLLMKATQGTRVDPRFLENWRDCAIRAPKVIRGAYHLIELDDPVEPQVRAFLSAVPGEGWPKGTIPPVLDVETSKIEEVKGNPAEDQEKILEWCSRVERETGVTPILYISPRGLKKLEGHTQGFERYPLWHVQYAEGLPRKAVPTPPPWKNWTFWQFTSKGDGQELGFESKHLDMDYFNGTPAELRLLASGGSGEQGLDVGGAIAYNASRPYSSEDWAMVLKEVGGSPWDAPGLVRKIIAWQSRQDLKPDGQVGPLTLGRMRQSS